MKTPLLVAIKHEMKKGQVHGERLLNGESLGKFRALIAPRLDQNSILFPEGHYEGGLISPTHHKYSLLSNEVLGSALAGIESLPSLCFADRRAQLSVPQRRRYFENMSELFTYCTRCIALDKIPQDIPDAVRMIKENDISYRVITDPLMKIKKVANDLVRIHEGWDSFMVEKLTHFANLDHACFLVAGAAHCISVHLRTGWPIEFFETLTEQKKLEDFLRGCINIPVFGKLIRGY